MGMAKYCTKCGSKLKGTETYCTKCGNSILTTNKVNKNNSVLSTIGFILSLLGFITVGLTSVLGLILCIIGCKESKKNGTKDGMGIAGIIISL